MQLFPVQLLPAHGTGFSSWGAPPTDGCIWAGIPYQPPMQGGQHGLLLWAISFHSCNEPKRRLSNSLRPLECIATLSCVMHPWWSWAFSCYLSVGSVQTLFHISCVNPSAASSGQERGLDALFNGREGAEAGTMRTFAAALLILASRGEACRAHTLLQLSSTCRGLMCD